MTGEVLGHPLQIDVGELVQRTVASLYSSLVTRPTGRAVRLAIESQLAETETTSFGLIDLSEVTILDFSCADEVVAKLLQRYLPDDRPRDAFFIFRADAELHGPPIHAVLDRHSLAAVSVAPSGNAELIGARSEIEAHTWAEIEIRGRVRPEEVMELFAAAEREAMDRLVARRLVFRSPISGSLHALSRIVADLGHPQPGD